MLFAAMLLPALTQGYISSRTVLAGSLLRLAVSLCGRDGTQSRRAVASERADTEVGVPDVSSAPRSRNARSERLPSAATTLPVSTADRVLLELTPAQVVQVARAATSGGSIAFLLSHFHEPGVRLDLSLASTGHPGISRSLINGLLVLATLPADGSYIGNKEVAEILNLNPSTANRYLATLVAVGLIERDTQTRKYRLAPLPPGSPA
jgi:hypothetical protein